MGKARRGIFGYREGVGRLVPRAMSDWFDPSCFLLEAESVMPEEEETKPYYPVAKLLLLLCAGIFLSRLTNLQITQGSENRFLAEGNRVREQVTVAPRGSIVDDKGKDLVTNEPGYTLDLIPSDLPRNKSDRVAIYKTLAAQTKVSVDSIKEQVDKAGITSLDPISLEDNVAREQALIYKIKFSQMAGVRVSFQPTRKYDTTLGLSHLLGYTSRMTEQDLLKHPDYHRLSPIGRAGVESSYDAILRGDEGTNEIEVNANGQFQRILQNALPKVGKTLHLTLDSGLETEMAAALEEAMGKNGAKQAVGIAMDPNTGGILASVSLPSYDNNAFAKGVNSDDYKQISNDPEKPLLNRAVDGLYPAGSTIKPFVAAAALQEKTIQPNTTLDTSAGKIKIAQWEFPDWKVHGITDVRLAIAQSNDIFFYALGGGYDKIPGLGVDRLKKYFAQFGFGEPTGVDYASDNKGLIPDPDWKKKTKKESWYIGDTYHMSIGQGDLLVTPLQLARGLSSLVNGGRVLEPHLVDSIESPDTGKVEKQNFSEKKLAISNDAIQVVRDGMHQTVDSDTGSARTLRGLPFSSAGKTGTAQFGTEQKTHAWYMGYAPADNPQIVVAVIVEGGGEGNAISVPVAGRVFQYYMSHK